MTSRLIQHKTAALLSAALLFSLPGVNLQAQALSFHELEQRVLDQSYDIAAQQRLLEALQNKDAAERAALWPQLRTFYRYAPDEFFLPEDGFNSKHYFSVRLSQDIMRLTKVRAGKRRAATAESEIGRLQLRDKQREALLAFRTTYLDLLEDQSRVEHYRRLVEIYRKLHDIQVVRQQHREALRLDVLQAEEQLLEYRGLLDFYRNRFTHTRALLADYLALSPEQIRVEDTESTYPPLSETHILKLALANSTQLQADQAREKIEAGRRLAATYSSFSFTPFVGYRLRTSRFSTTATGLEVGLSLSVPLSFLSMRHHVSRRYQLRAEAWQLQRQEAAHDLQRQVTELLDRYRFVSAQMAQTAKLVEVRKEKIRIQQARKKKALRNGKDDPASLLALRADLVRTELKLALQGYQQTRLYYRILALAGFLWPRELPRSPIPDVTVAFEGLWVWDTMRFLHNPLERKALVRFCQTHGVKRLFLSVNQEVLQALQAEPDSRQLLCETRTTGTRVSALLGEPLWVQPDHRQNLETRIRGILAYNRTAAATERFSGVHLDIEPHVLPQWQEIRQTLLAGLLQSVAGSKRLLDQDAAGLALEVDLPAFYAKVDSATVRKIFALPDLVTVMVYGQPVAEKVVRASSLMRRFARQQKTDFLLGLRAKDFDREQELGSLLEALQQEMGAEERFQGVAIHDLAGYRLLRKKRDAFETVEETRR